MFKLYVLISGPNGHTSAQTLTPHLVGVLRIAAAAVAAAALCSLPAEPMMTTTRFAPNFCGARKLCWISL